MFLFYLLGPNHPMKPQRLSVTHSLVAHYGLWKKMQVSHYEYIPFKVILFGFCFFLDVLVELKFRNYLVSCFLFIK